MTTLQENLQARIRILESQMGAAKEYAKATGRWQSYENLVAALRRLENRLEEATKEEEK